MKPSNKPVIQNDITSKQMQDIDKELYTKLVLYLMDNHRIILCDYLFSNESKLCNNITLTKFLYYNYKSVLREYEASTGSKLQVGFLK